MKEKGKIVLICGNAFVGSVSASLHTARLTDNVVIIQEEKKERKETIELKITNSLYDLTVQTNSILPFKPVHDWDRKNYQQRNKKHKYKRK